MSPPDLQQPVLISLLGGGFVAAFLHAALPTHWLPFTLVGRAQGWRPRRILLAVTAAGLAHIATTAVVGGLIVAAGLALDQWIGGILPHLAAVLPRRRAGLAWTVAAVVALGIPAWLGTQWLDRMRLSNTLYMSSLFPPSLRMAPAVPVPQFLQKAQSLRGKLDRRLRDDGQADDDE